MNIKSLKVPLKYSYVIAKVHSAIAHAISCAYIEICVFYSKFNYLELLDSNVVSDLKRYPPAVTLLGTWRLISYDHVSWRGKWTIHTAYIYIVLLWL